MSTCFFIGHRDTPEYIHERLCVEVERLITEYGVLHFVVGNRGAFDSMAATAVKKAKQNHPGVTLHLLIAYHPAERPVETPSGFDGTLYPFDKPVPHRVAIVKANRAMIDSCDYLIAYATHPGNARDLIEYAQKQQVALIRIDGSCPYNG